MNVYVYEKNYFFPNKDKEKQVDYNLNVDLHFCGTTI